MKRTYRHTPALIYSLLLASLVLSACAHLTPQATPTASPSPNASVTLSATPLATASFTPSPTLEPTFAPPQTTPVTPIPSPAALIAPPNVQVAFVLGTDQLTPYVGRSKAVTLLFFNPQTSRASLVSLPPDLFVYIPGFTMQRLSTAYAVGGYQTMADTMRYNFGVRPSLYGLVHLNDFTNFIDELGGITVQASQPVPEYCGDNPAGRVDMDGQQAFCYVRLRFGNDEADRNRRQQEVYNAVFWRLVHGGTLSRLPALYKSFSDSIETNLTLTDFATYLPLALRLGDPSRIESYYLSDNDLTPWNLPDQPLEATVLLPNLKELESTIRQAVQFVLTPAPFSKEVATLVHEVTVSPTPTSTPTSTATSTRTPTPYRSPVPTRTPFPTQTLTPKPTKIPTNIPPIFPTRSTPLPTATLTRTPTVTATP